MICRGRTVLSERGIGEFRIVEAVYATGTVDPMHDHPWAHVSVVVAGKALDVRDGIPQWNLPGMVTSQAVRRPHRMYFPVETRVASIATERPLPLLEPVPVACELEELRTSDDISCFLDTAVRHVTFASPPNWMQQVVRAFPWSSSVPLRIAARRGGVSQAHFDRTFRRCFGQSPREYRRRAKIARASKLLLESRLSIAEIALVANFSDQSHLTAAFVRGLGITPAEYRHKLARTS